MEDTETQRLRLPRGSISILLLCSTIGTKSHTRWHFWELDANPKPVSILWATIFDIWDTGERSGHKESSFLKSFTQLFFPLYHLNTRNRPHQFSKLHYKNYYNASAIIRILGTSLLRHFFMLPFFSFRFSSARLTLLAIINKHTNQHTDSFSLHPNELS